LSPGPANLTLFEKLLALHGIGRKDVDLVRVSTLQQVTQQVKDRRPDALFLAGPRGEAQLAGALRSYTCGTNQNPKIVSINETARLFAGNKTFSTVELSPGELLVEPALPVAETDTLGFPSLLVARQDLSDWTVEAFLKQLFIIRQALASDYPAAARIEPLPTDRGSSFALHDGATRFYDSEDQNLLDQYETLIWIVLLGFGGIASAVLWVGRFMFPWFQTRATREHHGFEEILQKVHQASTAVELDDCQQRLEGVLLELSGLMVRGDVDVELLPAYEMLAGQVSGAIERRRLEQTGNETGEHR